MKLPTWMRTALFTTAAMNILVAGAFVPPARALRELGGLPEAGHPLYMTTLGALVLLFGLGYLWAAATGRADPVFVAVSAAGKLSFFGLLVWFWAAGALPLRAPMAGSADLVLGIMFLVWLYGVRARREERPVATRVPHRTSR